MPSYLYERKPQIDLSSYLEGLYIIKLTGDEINILKKQYCIN